LKLAFVFHCQTLQGSNIIIMLTNFQHVLEFQQQNAISCTALVVAIPNEETMTYPTKSGRIKGTTQVVQEKT